MPPCRVVLCPSQSGSSSSTPDVSPPEKHADGLSLHSPTSGTVVPNRIFVGGIDYSVNDSDLRHVFSQHGAVQEVKIVTDRSGMSKGYGFVTFETQEDALKILSNANGICCKDKKLLIGQAIRKHQSSQMPPCLTTPYTYHSGVAYFHCPSMMRPKPVSVESCPGKPTEALLCSESRGVLSGADLFFLMVQLAMPSGAAVCSQPSDYVYQPADGGSVQNPVAVMEDGAAEVPLYQEQLTSPAE
uniref:Protein boule-like n=1 Tax=Acanthochromis polyacanthus TaxID=80966 RepID=A0A3Q1ELE7_9TELE